MEGAEIEDEALAGAFVRGCGGALAGVGLLSPAFAGGAGALDGVSKVLLFFGPFATASFLVGRLLLAGALAAKGEPLVATFLAGDILPCLVGGAPGGDGFFKLTGIFWDIRRCQLGMFFCKRSRSLSCSTFARFLPSCSRSSKVLKTVSVIASCVSSDPPTIEKSSACVTLV